jgi:hypothetical protein
VEEAIVEGGSSRNAAAKRFDVNFASAVRWVPAFLGMTKIVSEDAVRHAFEPLDEVEPGAGHRREVQDEACLANQRFTARALWVMHCALVWLMPISLAMVRMLQCVALRDAL